MIGPIQTHAPRFLVLRGGAIGDFIATLPVLQALREQWPRARIQIWGYPHIADLAVAGGLAESVVSLDRAEMARFFVPQADLTPAQCQAIAGFDLIFNYLHDPDGYVQENLLRAGARQVISGSPIISHGHAVPFLLAPLEALAIYGERVPELDFSPERREKGRQRLQAWGVKGCPLAVHVGSGSPSKKWPLERYLEILRRWRHGGGEVVAVLGEADAAEAAILTRELPDVPRLMGLSLTELAAALMNCSGFLGNDSGVAHLAAAVGLPVFVLFGPSDAEKWSPRGRRPIHVMRAPQGELKRLEISMVWEALRSFFSSAGTV